MSLVGFHRSLIVTAIVFCYIYAGWETRSWLVDGGAGSAMMAALFALIGAGFVVYLIRLSSILRLEE